MQCYVCGAKTYLEILNMGPTPIWTDFCDKHNRKPIALPCVLRQCESCGHVYQPISSSLRDQLEELYLSAYAQGVSSMGMGNWGIDRANRLFFDHVSVDQINSALEIGCGDAYLLEQLRSRGVKHLVGVEPSAKGSDVHEGILIVNEFLDPKIDFQQSFDLVYSIAVFEHIQEINDVLKFCNRVLANDGELFLVVPDCQRALETGDPGMFIHQHIHYFTGETIRSLLAKQNLLMTRSKSVNGNLMVFARRHVQPSSAHSATPKSYVDYQTAILERLTYLKNILDSDRVIVHGACNALNNLAAWIGGEYTLVDNDENKIGRSYCGMRVLDPNEIALNSIDTIVVSASEYFSEIREDYMTKGFTGDMLDISGFSALRG